MREEGLSRQLVEESDIWAEQNKHLAAEANIVLGDMDEEVAILLAIVDSNQVSLKTEAGGDRLEHEQRLTDVLVTMAGGTAPFTEGCAFCPAVTAGNKIPI